MIRRLFLLIFVVFLVGCSTMNMPAEEARLEREYQAARQALSQAERWEAPQYASQPYQQARDLLEQARQQQQSFGSLDVLDKYQQVQILAHQATIDALAQQLKDSMTRAESLTQETEDLRQTLTEIESKAGRVPELVSQTEQLRREVDFAEARNKRLENRVGELQQMNSDLENQLRDRNRTLESLRSRLNDSQERLEQLTNQKNKLQTRLEDQSSEIDDLTGRLDQKETTLNQLTNQRNLAFERIDDLSSALSERQSEIQDLRSRLEKKNQQLTELQARYEQHQDSTTEQIQSLRSRLQSANRKLDQFQSQKNLLSSRLQDELRASTRASRRARELEEQLAEQNQRIEDLRRRNQSIAEEFREKLKETQAKVRQERGRVILNLQERILFDLGSAKIKPDGKETLQKIGTLLKNYPDRMIRVEGHTDTNPIHTPRYPTNWELSTHRASNVLRYLVEEKGLSNTRIYAAGFGEYHPLVPNTTSENQARNRRVEIVLLPKTLPTEPVDVDQ